MATPTADQYSVASGETLRAGRFDVSRLLVGHAAGAAAVGGALNVSGDPGQQTDVTTLTLSMIGTQPFTVGQAFKKGDIPIGSAITMSCTQHQADVRNRWSDGSVKFAVLSGVSAPGTITVRRDGSPYSATNVAEPDVDAVVSFSEVVDHSGATVAAGAFSASLAVARANGAQAWSRTAAHRIRQILGPVMSEFHYFAPTADEHTHVWFYVRAYQTGAVEVDTVVQNGWTMVANPGRRDYHATVSVGGVQRYTSVGASKIQHFHHTRWSRSDWVGDDPAVVPQHNVQYLQSVSLFPRLAVSSLDPSIYAAQPGDGGRKFAAWTHDIAERPPPFDAGSVDPALGAGGFTSGVGVLPMWDMTWLVEADPRAYFAVVGHGRTAGVFPMFYTDELTGRPCMASQYPQRAILDGPAPGSGAGLSSSSAPDPIPVPSGGLNSNFNGNGWKWTHGPKMGYVAYLATGRWHFADVVQHYATAANLAKWSAKIDGKPFSPWWISLRATAHIIDWQGKAAQVAPQYANGGSLSAADSNMRTEMVDAFTASIKRYWNQYCPSGTVDATATDASWSDNALGAWYHHDGFETPGDYDVIEHSGQQWGFMANAWIWNFLAEAPTTEPAKLTELAVFACRAATGFMAATPTSPWGDYRICTSYHSATGRGRRETPGQVPFATWAASWEFYRHDPKMWWSAGGDPIAEMPTDTWLRRFNVEEGQKATPVPMPTMNDGGSDTNAFAWVFAGAHEVSARTSVPGSVLMAANYFGSATWLASLTAPNGFRYYPGCAVDSRAREPALPAWVPATVGTAALVPMTNTVWDAMTPTPAHHYAYETSGIGDYSGGFYDPNIGDWGAFYVHGGGHATTENNGIFRANLGTLAWDQVFAPTRLEAAGKFVDYRGVGSNPESWEYQYLGSSYGYFIRFGPNSTGWADPANTALQEYTAAQTNNNENPLEVAPGVPGSQHSYASQVVIPVAAHAGYGTAGSFVRPGSSAVGQVPALGSGFIHGYKVAEGTWWRATDKIPMSHVGPCASVWDAGRKRVWRLLAGGATAQKQLWLNCDVFPPTVSQSVGTCPPINGYVDNVIGAMDSDKDVIVHITSLDGFDSDGAPYWYWFSPAISDSARNLVTWTNGSAPPSMSGGGRAGMGGSVSYVQELGKFVYYARRTPDKYYEISVPASPASAWTWVEKTIIGATPSTLAPAPHGHMVTRMAYSQRLKCLLWVTGTDINVSTQFGGRVVAIRVAP